MAGAIGDAGGDGRAAALWARARVRAATGSPSVSVSESDGSASPLPSGADKPLISNPDRVVTMTAVGDATTDSGAGLTTTGRLVSVESSDRRGDNLDRIELTIGIEDHDCAPMTMMTPRRAG